MKIVVDAFGGDNAPEVVIDGVLLVDDPEIEIILVGEEKKILSLASAHKSFKRNASRKISLVNASEIIGMDEQPTTAVRYKKDSSINVGMQLLAKHQADAFFSAGNSGAIMASALLYLRRLPGVIRPAIATILPTQKDFCVLLDVGANVDCRPQHLYQFALMGTVYYEEVFGKKNPRVGILSIGEEETKGNTLTLEAKKLLRSTDLNFIGNVEGRDIPAGNCDVIVCDGFIGNIILKFGEGVAKMIMKLVKEAMHKHPLTWVSLPFLWGALKDLRRQIDYTEYGGAPLLGVDGICLIGHGRSNVRAIASGIKMAARLSKHKIPQKITQIINQYQITENNNG